MERHRVPEEAAGRRVDVFLSRKKNISRSQVSRWIREGRVRLVSGERLLRPAARLKAGDEVELDVPEGETWRLEPEEVPFEVVFFQKSFVVVNKPPGLVVHPGAGNPRGTLVHGLLARFPQLEGIGGIRRPGLVHRLDKETSGLLAAALSQKGFEILSRQVKERRMRRLYVALVEGAWHGFGRMEAPIGRDRNSLFRKAVDTVKGKPARTFFKVIACGADCALVLFQLDTGRTHQIRVHARLAGHPIRGDVLYGAPRGKAGRVLLHALRLGFYHPETEEWREWCVPPPADFSTALREAGILEPEWDKISFLEGNEKHGRS